MKGDTTVCTQNRLNHLVSNVNNASAKTPVKINQDVDGYAAELALGQSVNFTLPVGRQAYLLCVEGSLDVNSKSLTKYDACEMTGEGVVEIKVREVEETENGLLAHFLMFVMREVPGSGRSDVQ